MAVGDRLKDWWQDRRSPENQEGRINVGEPTYFLPALLAEDPVLYLVDGEGRVVDHEGEPIRSQERLDEVHPPGIQRLITKAMGLPPHEDGSPRTEDLFPRTPLEQ